MDYENILYNVKDRVCKITLNRPEKVNALSWALRQELYAALKRAERDDDVGCIIIKGAGRAFSAGYDLTPVTPSPNRPVEGYVGPWADALTGQYAKNLIQGWWIIWDLLKPVIAQVHGYALAGASELASMCDMIIIADDAQMGYPPVRAISSPDTFYHPWNMHLKKAKELLLTGRSVTGKEAVEIGWANHSFPADRLEAETESLAKKIATIAPDLLACSKKGCNRAYEIMGIRTALEVGSDWMAISNFRQSAGEFARISREKGLRAALDWRDGPWGDYRTASTRPAVPKSE